MPITSVKGKGNESARKLMQAQKRADKKPTIKVKAMKKMKAC